MIRGDRVLAARKARRLTQRKLAEACDTDVAYISKIERESLPGATIQTLERLAEALNVSADYLLGFSDTPDRHESEAEKPPRRRAAVKG